MRRKIKRSIQRILCMWFLDEPAYAFVNRPDENERLTSLLSRAGVSFTTLKDHKKLTIEITIRYGL